MSTTPVTFSKEEELDIMAKVRLAMNIHLLIEEHRSRCTGCTLPIIEIIEDAQRLGIWVSQALAQNHNFPPTRL